MSQNWKTPNELIKLHKLKQKRKALQTRVDKIQTVENEQKCPLEAVFAQKRKNPFLKNTDVNAKKQKHEISCEQIEGDTLFDLIHKTEVKATKEEESKSTLFSRTYNSKNFEHPILEDEDVIEEQNSSPHLPIDWSLKTRMRVLCGTPIPGSNLKTSQEASGLTNFVRCIDPQNSSASTDISPGTRFYQSTLYWQHPHIPWMTLFPRNSKANVGIQVGELEKESLAKDWTESFRGLFQLLRARQCPYFYVCANTFTVLFRAAGIGGRAETHALLSPTTRGMRNALKQEEIEYLQPLLLKLKKESNLNNSNEGNESLSNSEEGKSLEVDASEVTEDDKDSEDDDDIEDENWLESLGVDTNEIKKINSTYARQKNRKEMSDDFSDNSIVLIEGVECQAFFNFLLNAKSTIANVGRLAGVPPTLLAPIAFPGATMRSLQMRSSKIRMDATDYFSVELKGIILPHILSYISDLLIESKDAFSATLASNSNTLAFTKASKKLIEDSEKQNIQSDEVFGKENLSDCGLSGTIIELMCRATNNAVNIMERMCYSKDKGFTWS